MKVDENIRSPLVGKQSWCMWECWRQSFHFESEVCSNDSASSGVVCVIYKGACISNEGTVWASSECRRSVGLETGIAFGSLRNWILILNVLQEWGRIIPNMSFTCCSNLVLTFRTWFSKSVEHNCMLCANASAQIQASLWITSNCPPGFCCLAHPPGFSGVAVRVNWIML